MADMKKWDSGRETTSAHGGQKIMTDFPLDRSSGQGDNSKCPARGKELAGDMDDLSHSLKGASAHQSYSQRGNTDKVKYPSKP